MQAPALSGSAIVDWLSTHASRPFRPGAVNARAPHASQVTNAHATPGVRAKRASSVANGASSASANAT